MPSSDELKAVVDTVSGAVLAISWKWDGSKLVFENYYNPPDRVEAIKATTGSDELYTTASSKITFEKGQGGPGRAFDGQTTEFHADVKTLDPSVYPRAELAKKFGITSVAFKGTAEGCIEVGTTETWGAAPAF